MSFPLTNPSLFSHPFLPTHDMVCGTSVFLCFCQTAHHCWGRAVPIWLRRRELVPSRCFSTQWRPPVYLTLNRFWVPQSQVYHLCCWLALNSSAGEFIAQAIAFVVPLRDSRWNFFSLNINEWSCVGWHEDRIWPGKHPTMQFERVNAGMGKSASSLTPLAVDEPEIFLWHLGTAPAWQLLFLAGIVHGVLYGANIYSISHLVQQPLQTWHLWKWQDVPFPSCFLKQLVFSVMFLLARCGRYEQQLAHITHGWTPNPLETVVAT